MYSILATLREFAHRQDATSSSPSQMGPVSHFRQSLGKVSRKTTPSPFHRMPFILTPTKMLRTIQLRGPWLNQWKNSYSQPSSVCRRYLAYHAKMTGPTQLSSFLSASTDSWPYLSGAITPRAYHFKYQFQLRRMRMFCRILHRPKDESRI